MLQKFQTLYMLQILSSIDNISDVKEAAHIQTLLMLQLSSEGARANLGRLTN